MNTLGYSFDEIGEKLGVSRQMAHRYIKQEIQGLVRDTREECLAMRELEIERLDKMLSTIWHQALEGDFNAFDRVLKILDRQTKIMALDELTKSELNVKQEEEQQTARDVIVVPAVSNSVEEWMKEFAPK